MQQGSNIVENKQEKPIYNYVPPSHSITKQHSLHYLRREISYFYGYSLLTDSTTKSYKQELNKTFRFC